MCWLYTWSEVSNSVCQTSFSYFSDKSTKSSRFCHLASHHLEEPRGERIRILNIKWWLQPLCAILTFQNKNYEDGSCAACRTKLIFFLVVALAFALKVLILSKSIKEGEGAVVKVHFFKISLAMLSSRGTHSGAALWCRNSASPLARAVLHSPELLSSILLGLHGHRTNKNPS